MKALAGEDRVTQGFKYRGCPADFCHGPDCPAALSPGPDPGLCGTETVIQTLSRDNRPSLVSTLNAEFSSKRVKYGLNQVSTKTI